MSLPKDFVCRAFHYCWLDCHGCLAVKLASADELKAAKDDKASYKAKWGFK